jgi:apolipoprotein N-acyltransferase
MNPQIWLCLCSGLLSALAFSTLSTGWVIWFALVPFFHVLYREPLTLRRGAFYGWLFGMAFYIGAIHWLKELHPLTWLPGVTDTLSLLIVYGGLLGISLVVSVWPTLFGLLLAWLKPQSRGAQVVIPALLWILMEWAQELGDVSLPWARLAVSQFQDLPLLQVVPLAGPMLIAGVIVAFNAALNGFISEFAPDPNPRRYWHYPAFQPLTLTTLVVLVLHLYGWQRLAGAPAAQSAQQGVTVGLIQGSIPQGQKWGSAEQYWQNVREIEKIYFDLSTQALAQTPEKTPRLLIWPESAVPLIIRYFPEYERHFSRFVQQHNTYLLTGMFDRKTWESPSLNGAVLFTPAGKMDGWYYKRQLVPFGEFFPYRAQLAALPGIGALVSALNPMKDDVQPGTSAALMNTPLGKVGTLICFESVYPHVARQSVREGAQLLAIVTNDGWYRDAIALYQHNAHAVLRALENGRYVLRAGNTGISSLIDPWGRIQTQSAPMARTFLSFQLDPQQVTRSELTPYTRFGNWVVLLSGLLLGGWLLRQRRSATA